MNKEEEGDKMGKGEGGFMKKEIKHRERVEGWFGVTRWVLGSNLKSLVSNLRRCCSSY